MIIDKSTDNFKKGSYLTERKSFNGNQTFNKNNDFYKDWLKGANLTEEKFKRRLERINLEQEQFLSLLEEKDDPELNKSTEWVNKLISINNYEGTIESEDILDHLFFGNFIKPFLLYAESELNTIKDQAYYKNSTINWLTVKRDILYYLGQLLMELSLRTIIQELQISKEIGELEGNSKEERFQYYHNVKLNQKNFRREIFGNYPVLARLLVEKTESHLNFCTEILYNYFNDYKILLKRFSNKYLLLQNLKMDSGDSHKDSRRVVTLYFNNQKIVYKPRSLEVDVQFNGFIDWINKNVNKFNFKYAKVLITVGKNSLNTYLVIIQMN